MRKKVRRVLAFLLAMVLAVSVMTGMALSAPAGSDEPETTPAATTEVQEEQTDAGASTNQAEDLENQTDADKTDADQSDTEQTDAPEAPQEQSAEEGDKSQDEVGEPAAAGEAFDQTAAAGSGDKTVTVRANAVAGVLPEGAKLVVKQLADTDSQYQDAADQLDASKIPYDGFLALDVGFEVDGKEVEPTGSVDVQFKLGAGLLPEGADTDSLAVQHLPDTGKVETVADTGDVTDGSIAVKSKKVDAAFTVDSFSTFTITWDDYFEVTVHYVDEKGERISTDTENLEIQNDRTITFTGKAISGYIYQAAHYGTYNGAVVTAVQASQTENNRIIRKLTFKEGDKTVATLTREGWDNDTQTADVYLVYRSTGGGTGGEITPAGEPAHTKTAIRNEDGTYDLSLTVKGSSGSATTPAKVDVLMIVDVSGSMEDNGRLTNMKKAMKTLVSALETNGHVDAQYDIVTFATKANCVYPWGSAGSNLTKTINNLSANGGTNYQAGLRTGKTQLNSAREGAQKIVIFLSDGAPTYYFQSNGEIGGNGRTSLSLNGTGWEATKNEAVGMYCDKFYSVGIGAAQSTYLTGIRDSVNATTKQYIAANDSGSNLATIFEDIAGFVTNIYCTNVTIADTLSNMAQVVVDADGKPAELKVKVTNAQGETVVTPEGITASYSNDHKTITLDFPDDYELNPDYTYTVTAIIEPSDAAYTAYAGTYPDTPAVGTGTHADAEENGFYCNSSATLSYNNGQEDKTADYDKPVIQLNKCSVTLKKVVAGNMGDTNKEFTFSASSNATPADTTLKHNETTTITAKVGDSVTITETDADGYTTKVTGVDGIYDADNRSFRFTVTSDMTTGNVITFTNTKNVEVPNGINSNIAPYIVMVAVAAGAGVYLVVRRRPRGRHCK